MITLGLYGHKIKMPSELNEITLDKGIQIMGAFDQEPIPSLNTKMAIISLMSNIPVLSIANWDDETIAAIWSKLPFERDMLEVNHLLCFKLKGTLYGMKTLDSLTVKELAQIDFYLNEGDTAYQYLGHIIATLFRPITLKNNSLKNILRNITIKLFIKGVSPRIYDKYEIEPLTDNSEELAETFLYNLDFNFGYSLINAIYDYKREMRDAYPILFKVEEEVKDEEEEVEEKNDTPEFEDIWSWYHLVTSVSKDLFEREAWWERPVTHFYKYLSYLKQQNAYNQRNG